jgi:hypothetical protein
MICWSEKRGKLSEFNMITVIFNDDFLKKGG